MLQQNIQVETEERFADRDNVVDSHDLFAWAPVC